MTPEAAGKYKPKCKVFRVPVITAGVVCVAAAAAAAAHTQLFNSSRLQIWFAHTQKRRRVGLSGVAYVRFPQLGEAFKQGYDQPDGSLPLFALAQTTSCLVFIKNMP